MWTPALGRRFGERMVEKIDTLTNEDFINFCWKNFNAKEEKNETLFSIVGGKSTDERTASRILAFFFDTTREHNMEDFFIKSFIEAAGEKYEDITKNHNFTVEKEFYTKHGKIIDILLLNPQCNIVIENKIYADLYNDLKEYYDTAKSKNAEKQARGYVLSLFDMQDSIDERNVGDKFKCVTYEKFLGVLEKNYKNYEYSKYFGLCEDFIKNMRSLEEKIMSDLDEAFWQKYKDVYEKLDKQRIAILKNKIDSLKKRLNEDIKGKKGFEKIKIKTWNVDNLGKTFCDDEVAYIASIWFDYTPKGAAYIIQPNIIVSLREGISIYINANKRGVKKNLLDEIKNKKGQYNGENGQFYLYIDQKDNEFYFDLNANEEKISNFIINFLQNIK